MPALPARPSSEHLRKAAKRLARERALPLAAAQRSLSNEYGFRSWAALIRHVASPRPKKANSPRALFEAVRAGDVDRVERLLSAGANPRIGDGRQTALHVAARRGPLALVEALIAGGALDWQRDEAGRTPLDVARRGRSPDRRAIIALLDRRSIADSSFQVAVDAIQAGDATGLARLLDAEPRLLRERIVGPGAYREARRHQYFLDPKLFWFVAFNPAAAVPMPHNMPDVASVMLELGVEPADLDYTLELTMSSSAAREAGQQLPLMRTLLESGATATRRAIVVGAAYGELAALRALIDAGRPLDAPLAAALGFDESLQELLPNAAPSDVQTAFGLAVINGRTSAAKLALDAGADVNAALPVHEHSTALHQAAENDDAGLIDFLLAHGARREARDTLWDATPLDWAIHQKRPAAQAALERAAEAATDR